jgi:hypothetical protein
MSEGPDTGAEAPQSAAAKLFDLWMGLGMLVIGAFFTTWWRLRPLQRPEPQPDQPQSDIGAGP